MSTQKELYLLQTIHDMVDIARGIDDKKAMLAELDKLADKAEFVMEEIREN